MRRGRHHDEALTSSDFAPIRVVEVDIDEPLPRLEAEGGEGSVIPYTAALCLVRLHGAPLGSIRVDLQGSGLDPDGLARRIQAELGTEIDRHLRHDGLASAGTLSAEGLRAPGRPSCLAPLDDFLGRAPDVSVVIPTRNRPASALETLSSILRSNYPRNRYEAIVVDNGSGDDERVELPEAEERNGVKVRLLHERAPGGSNARNAGLLAARGEIVAFCDDDVLVDRNWLASLALAFDLGERVGGAAGLSLPRDLETPAQVWFEGFATAVRGFERLVLDRRNPPEDRPLFPFTVGDFGTGQNFSFRRELLIELGGFDPALGTATTTLGGEDVEAMFRVLLADRQVIYEPRAMAWHAHPRDFEQFERRVWGYGVGLTACFTKVLLQHPRLLSELVRKLPGGLAYALSPRSAKNEGKPADYPSRLTRLELRGMAYGPLAYARSRRAQRKAIAPTHDGLRR